MVAEEVCGVIGEKSHDRAFFINVLTIRSNALGGVDHRSVSLSRCGTGNYVEGKVAISIDPS